MVGLLPSDLSEAQFSRIAQFAHSNAGIVLDAGKRSMVQSRLAKRVRGLKLGGFQDYLDLLQSEDGLRERRELISLLTTNVTGFFREAHHFELLKTEILPDLAERLRRGGRVRIWSAGCSYGNEPYSIAMICREVVGERTDLDLRILATDIDTHVIEAAATGRFSREMVQAMPATYRDRFMSRDEDGGWSVRKPIRDLVAFRELNLMADWPMRGTFDVVFCRNVVIYFDVAGQERLFQRLARIIPEGGWLCIGHSERIAPSTQRFFRSAAITAYRRTDAS